jgi:oxygen-dependent protoporphyrinogen oxidase
MEREPTVAVVGAGLAGLTAAYRLSRERDSKGRALRIVVLESSSRVGGLIETVARDGFTVERAADSMITEKPWGLELCRDLGLEPDVITTNAACRRSFVVRGPA